MLLILALTLASGAPPDAPLLALPPPGDDRPLSRLAPLDPDSPWQQRFAEVAADLQPALAHGGPDDWLPYFGGQWLVAADRVRVAAVLTDANGGLRRAFASRAASEHVILGWVPPEGPAAYADLADRPEADAIICWRPGGSDVLWPTNAAEAADTQRHGCVRISYSVRFKTPMWRAFFDPAAEDSAVN
jgi:hypothetical protein